MLSIDVLTLLAYVSWLAFTMWKQDKGLTFRISSSFYERLLVQVFSRTSGQVEIYQGLPAITLHCNCVFTYYVESSFTEETMKKVVFVT
jgi:hypothetical protein